MKHTLVVCALLLILISQHTLVCQLNPSVLETMLEGAGTARRAAGKIYDPKAIRMTLMPKQSELQLGICPLSRANRLKFSRRTGSAPINDRIKPSTPTKKYFVLEENKKNKERCPAYLYTDREIKKRLINLKFELSKKFHDSNEKGTFSDLDEPYFEKESELK